jgi:Zn-dependent protease with chaperone function
MLYRVQTKKRQMLKSFTASLVALMTVATPPVQGGNGHLYKKNQNEENHPKFRPSEKAFETTEIFSTLMNDSAVSGLWHEYQSENLQTMPDRILENFLKNHPFFAQIYHLLESNQGPMLERFMMAQLNSNRLITPNSDSDSLRIRRLVITVAKKMGFTDEAIDKMSLFMQIGGSANAFTVSGSIDHIVVSINMETVKQMQDVQLEAVIAHELFHIVRGHVVKGAIMDLMFGVMMQTLTQPADQFSLKSLSSEINTAAWLNPSNFNSVTGQGEFNMLGQRRNANSLISFWLKSLNPDARQQIHYSIFTSLVRMPEANRKQLISDFLQAVVQGLRTTGYEVRQEVYSYLGAIISSLNSKSAYTPKYNREEMQAFFKVIAETYSRAQETSCDMGAASLVQNLEVASAMSLLVLGDRTTNNLDRLRSVLNAQEAYKINAKTLEENPAYLADLLEGMDHPPINMRINTIMEHFPAYPLILSANGFTRLLLVEQILRENAAHPEQAWARMANQQALENMTQQASEKAAAAKEGTPEPKGPPAGGDGAEADANKITVVLKSGEKLNAPLELAQYFTKKQNELIDTVIQLIIDLESRITKAGARNVRLDNLLQFIGANYQALIQQHQLLNARIEVLKKQQQPSKMIEIQTQMFQEQVKRVEEQLASRSILVEKLTQSLAALKPANETQRVNLENRLGLLKDLEKLAPALEVGKFNTTAISLFQQKVTPNTVIEGITSKDGGPVFSRSRIPYDAKTCEAVLKGGNSE